MKLFLSFVAVATVLLAPTTAATAAKSPAKSGLRRTLDSTLGPASNKYEICFPGGDETLSKSKAALLQSLATLVVNGHKNKSGSGGPPQYVFGCGLFDFDCYECDLCQDVYGLLLEAGSQVACDAACVGIVETTGGGPEDRT